MTDRLTLTRALEGGGMASAAAERIATEIYDAIRDNVATKIDLERIETALRTDLRELEQRLDGRFAAINGRFNLVEERLGRQIDRVVIRLGGVAVVLLGLLFAALHLWPPH